MASEKPSVEAVKKDSNVDTTNMGRSVWIMKVPKHIDDLWKAAPSDMEVARLKIFKDKKTKKVTEINLDLSESLLKTDVAKKVPKHYKVSHKTVKNETLGVLSEEQSESELKLALDGCVATKLEARPVDSTKYFALKAADVKKRVDASRKPVQILEHVVRNYKPVSNHKHNIEYERKKKSEGPKIRSERDKVLKMLFEAFEDHQFYLFKDLIQITQQPEHYLKEILREVGNFNKKPPHNNMWELKPEYRHYDEKAKEDKKEEDVYSD